MYVYALSNIVLLQFSDCEDLMIEWRDLNEDRSRFRGEVGESYARG